MPWIYSAPSKFIAELEKTGEEEVRAALLRGDEWITHEGRSAIVEHWLKSKRANREKSFKEWFLKPLIFEVCKYILIALVAFIGGIYFSDIKNMFYSSKESIQQETKLGKGKA